MESRSQSVSRSTLTAPTNFPVIRILYYSLPVIQVLSIPTDECAGWLIHSNESNHHPTWTDHEGSAQAVGCELRLAFVR
jgi:hypothetical protein